MRRAVATLAGLIVVGVLALIVAGLTGQTRDGFTLGVTSGAIAAELKPGDVVCQAPVRIPDSASDFSRIQLALGTYRKPGPALELTVTPIGSTTPIAQARIAPGYPDLDITPTRVVPVGPVDTRSPLRICIRNRGTRRVAVMGNGGAASRTTSATLDGKSIDTDLNLSFQRASGRSLLSLVPAMFRRASLFRAGWVGAWTYVLAALALALAVPALLLAALRSTEES